MKESKKYQLARKCSNQLKNIHSCLQSLPSRIEQEGNHHHAHLQHQNIFRQRNQPQQSPTFLAEDTGYRYVGIKQLKSYQTRNGQKKRNLNSLNKRSSDSVLSFSRISTTKAQVSHLNKQDLIEQLLNYKASCANEKSEEVYMEESKFLSSTIELSNCSKLKNQSVEINVKVAGDITNIKSMRKKYENIWSKAICERRQQKTHKKHRSILQNVADFREKMQVKQRNHQIQKTMNISPKDWEAVLHEQKSLKTIHQKQLTKICSSMKVTGSKKKLKELSWVQQKDKEGFVFKVPSNLTSPRFA